MNIIESIKERLGFGKSRVKVPTSNVTLQPVSASKFLMTVINCRVQTSKQRDVAASERV